MENKLFALVTGASTGLGNAIAHQLANDGYTVFAGVRNHADMKLFNSNNQIIPIILDVTRPDNISEAYQLIKEKTQNFGLSVLINNAGINYITAFELADESKERQLMEVNLFGAMSLTRVMLPLLHQHVSEIQSTGKIINVSSIGGIFGLPWEAAYHASKFALLGWSQSLRYELHALNISVCCFIPGGMKTRIFQKSMGSSGGNELKMNHRHYSYYKRNVEKMNVTMQNFEKSAATPQHAAKAMSKLLKKKTLPLKSFFGTDAKFIRALSWLGLTGLLKGQFITK